MGSKKKGKGDTKSDSAKSKDRRVTAFEKDLKQWLLDPEFKEKYDTAIAEIVTRRLRRGEVPVPDET